ncbi:MAG: SpoIID/LytB domain-containing protein, partial [Pseudomonadota bacterium]
MSIPETEPAIAVGLIEHAPHITFQLHGDYYLDELRLSSGRYTAYAENTGIALAGDTGFCLKKNRSLHVLPLSPETCFFSISGIPIGKSFHWERLQDQTFHGDLILDTFASSAITATNKIHLERYLESVICSEMSPRSHKEFLKAHCIISRSWLLAQLERKARTSRPPGSLQWTDCEAHEHFDVCADDHCQRYHGIGRINHGAQRALEATRGEALMFEDAVCDTRFSKCCGGISERFSTAWEDVDVPYLTPVADCPEGKEEFLPSDSAEEAARFISAQPEAYCNITDRKLLERILPDFDFETKSFFRWEVSLSQDELKNILLEKTGIAFGDVQEIAPLARGASGRIYQLKIRGTKAEKIFGKELEIRRALSASHLYSSAFIVKPLVSRHALPAGFTFRGAGWG